MRPTILAGVAATLLLVAAATPAAAKEDLEASLDAPIAMGTPWGTELLVGVTVTVPDGEASHPVDGSPIYLRLTGRDGSTTRAAGAADRTPGHYVMRIAVPTGGARQAEVGIHGTSDLPIRLIGDPFTLGGITPSTTQLAPPLAPALTPLPRASAVAAAPVRVESAARVGSAAAAGSQPLDIPLAFPALILVGLAGAAAILGSLAIRRSRAAAAQPARPRAPGA